MRLAIDFAKNGFSADVSHAASVSRRWSARGRVLVGAAARREELPDHLVVRLVPRDRVVDPGAERLNAAVAQVLAVHLEQVRELVGPVVVELAGAEKLLDERLALLGARAF